MDGLLDKQRDRDDEQREREDRLTKVLMAQLTPQPAISAEQLEALQVPGGARHSIFPYIFWQTNFYRQGVQPINNRNIQVSESKASR